MNNEEFVCGACGHFGKIGAHEQPGKAFDKINGSSTYLVICRECGVVSEMIYMKRMPSQVDIKCWSAENVRNSYQGALEEGLEDDAAVEYAANKFGLSEKGVREILRGR